MKRGEHKMIEKIKVFENHSENEKDIITQVVNGLTGTDAGVDLWKYKLEVDEIAMQVEELSAKTGGIPYTDILKEVADCLEL